MRRTGVLLGFVGLVAVLAAGCTQVSVGEPQPVESSVGSTGSGRPHEIDLTGKDPCALVPESDLPAFDIEKAGVPGKNEQLNAPQCSYNGNHHGYWVMLATNEGIEVWSNGSRNAEVDEVEPVDGFPAITLFTDFTPNGCDVVVDVADGQYLRTTILPDDTDVSLSESCDLAHKLAESAMSTLAGE
jgi:Protein of unknown function (DUF3558)